MKVEQGKWVDCENCAASGIDRYSGNDCEPCKGCGYLFIKEDKPKRIHKKNKITEMAENDL